MPWTTVTPMEETNRFVMLARNARFRVTERCEQFGISRKTGYKPPSPPGCTTPAAKAVLDLTPPRRRFHSASCVALVPLSPCSWWPSGCR